MRVVLSTGQCTLMCSGVLNSKMHISGTLFALAESGHLRRISRPCRGGISITLQECCLAALALLYQSTERRPQSSVSNDPAGRSY